MIADTPNATLTTHCAIAGFSGGAGTPPRSGRRPVIAHGVER